MTLDRRTAPANDPGESTAYGTSRPTLFRTLF